MTGEDAQGALLMWIFGSRGQRLPKYCEMHVDVGLAPGPGLSHAWEARSHEELLGEARKLQAVGDGLAGVERGGG